MENYQQLLFPYAYNILGSAEDARDAIQEVMAKHLSKDSSQVGNEQAYLIRGVINQSINVKKKRSREVSNKVWLPEPVATEHPDAPLQNKDILNYSMLVLLEKLKPRERAVFILKEAFDYTHKEIAETFQCSPENARTLFSRAKKKLSDQSNETKPLTQNTRIQLFLHQYIDAIRQGDMKVLEQLMSDDICIKADGGEKVNVVREITIGRTAAIELMIYVYRSFQSSQMIRLSTLNHQPALLFFYKGRLKSCQVFQFSDERISQIYSVIDPEKLRIAF